MENPIGFVTLLEAVDLVGSAMYGSSWRPFQEFGEQIPSNEELIEKGYLRPDARDNPGSVNWARRCFRSNLREKVIWTDPAIESVIYALAERCESGEIPSSYLTFTDLGGYGLGLADLPRGKWHAPHWRGYFVDGKIKVGVSLEDVPGIYTPEGFGRIFVRRDNLHRAIEKMAGASTPGVVAPVSVVVTPSAAVPAAPEKAAEALIQPKRRGAKVKYDWDDAFLYVHQLLGQRGDPLLPANAYEGWRSDADIGRAVQIYMQEHDEKKRLPDFKNLMKRIGPELTKWRQAQIGA
jgi:hypothetical protein